MKRRHILIVLLAAAAATAAGPPTLAPTAGPPNGPAEVKWDADRLEFAYDGRVIFSGRLEGLPSGSRPLLNVYRTGDKVNQVILLVHPDSRTKLRLSGTVFGSGEAFPCEADRRDRGPLLVRHVSGLSQSLLNRAVYDRRGDWVISVDANPGVVIKPREDTPASRTFGLEAEGAEIVLRFRPRYYQAHRGLRFFEPWSYAAWPGPVTGWISWFAFFDRVTEKDIVETADVVSTELRPYGYHILQVDDGYQSGNGRPELWLNANEKFPRGLADLAASIKEKGLTPGLWTNVAFNQADFAAGHADWFVRDAGGKPVRGNWVDFSLDASNPAAVDAVVRPVYRGLREMGWEYFKLDALRHLRYEGYNANSDYFRRKGVDLVAAYRDYVRAVREEIGRGVFLLGCWGIRPELIGLIDGCRIGTDGFSYAGLAQFNSWNNVVWRNDPDHIELNDDRYRSLTVTSLTGSVLLLTDKPGLYRTPAAEAARRAAPVLWTLPGQVFDVDPSRSDLLDRVDAEVSGSGPRVFDAGLVPVCDLYLLEVVRPFETWAVLGRTGEGVRRVRFADLGLDPSKTYIVFEFWSKKLLGSFNGEFIPGPLDPAFRVQALCIRERRPRPQLVATSRHLTCGGPELADLRWDGLALHGKSRLVAGDPYEIYVTEPAGFSFAGLEAEGARVDGIERLPELVKVRLVAPAGGDVVWTARFETGVG
ncbi:MAG: alpha-galactosidase [Candidatus Aminicenantes bacterium]|nr:alpha-galactosidase [Candidatus Aminicenantes bacterium]